MDATEVEDDQAREMTDALTSLCARLYGRSARTRAQRALRAAARRVANEAA